MLRQCGQSISFLSSLVESQRNYVDSKGAVYSDRTLIASTGGLCILMLLFSIHLTCANPSTKNPAAPEAGSQQVAILAIMRPVQIRRRATTVSQVLT